MRRRHVASRVAVATAMVSMGMLAVVASTSAASKPHTAAQVLLVGTFDGKAGGYTTIQSAVNAAKPGDWILVAPGDYHEDDDMVNPPTGEALTESGFGGVLITTSDLHLRGMNRNTVIVDGDKPNSDGACSAKAADQNFGYVPEGSSTAYGRNGIVVYKANNVSVDNLTVCNFASGSLDSGNDVWWNGGADSETIGLKGYEGSYLTATDTYYGGEQTASAYGIFSSDSAGPATWTNIYANNQNDSGMYVGACQQQCDITIDKAWMEYNALGYSGTNSGGAIEIEHSLFDNNEDGLDTNTQIYGDPPAPQNGDCPNDGISKVTHTHSCWVVYDNVFDDNNNINTPRAGSAAAGPTGTGMTISGGTNDTVMDNTFENNGAWGILFVPYPGGSVAEYDQSCTGTGGVENALFGCVYDPKNDALEHNTFVHDGYFGNVSNSDFGQITLSGGEPSNCYIGNKDPQGSYPTNLEKVQSKCGVTTKSANNGGLLFDQVLCDTGYGSCTSAMKYPQPTGVVLAPVPTKKLATMPNPCKGVPTNAWCKNGKPI